MSALANALAFARRGYAVVPLHWPVMSPAGKLVCSCTTRNGCGPSAAKHPYAKLAPNGLLSATTATGIIKGWFGYQVPDANYGVRTDGALLALDIDPRHDGDQTLAELERLHGSLPHTWRAITGSGGEHILFDAHGLTLKHGRAKDVGLGNGIDVPGYIVGVGSRHICGRHYHWNVDHHPSETPLARPPDWLIGLLNTNGINKGHNAAEWATDKAGIITEYRDAAIAPSPGNSAGCLARSRLCRDAGPRLERLPLRAAAARARGGGHHRPHRQTRNRPTGACRCVIKKPRPRNCAAPASRRRPTLGHQSKPCSWRISTPT